MYKFITIIIIIVTFCCLIACNDSTKPIIIPNIVTIDTVYSFIPGTGQNAGQDLSNFPHNIFGKPDQNATKLLPASSPNQILSLGLGGEITIGFKNYSIINNAGPDFIIFENVFINSATNKYFVEPAIVSVSKDGRNYKSFTFDSLSLIGCAGIHPTYWNDKSPLKSGGDKFDLDNIAMDTINFIKIKDISKMLLDNPDHPYYDAIINGFDLDAVIGINHVKK